MPKRERSACLRLALAYSSRETVTQSVRGAGAAETWLERSINPIAPAPVALATSAMGFFRLIIGLVYVAVTPATARLVPAYRLGATPAPAPLQPPRPARPSAAPGLR